MSTNPLQKLSLEININLIINVQLKPKVLSSHWKRPPFQLFLLPLQLLVCFNLFLKFFPQQKISLAKQSLAACIPHFYLGFLNKLSFLGFHLEPC